MARCRSASSASPTFAAKLLGDSLKMLHWSILPAFSRRSLDGCFAPFHCLTQLWYNTFMDYLLMGGAVCVIIALIAWYIKYSNSKNQKNTRQKNLQPVKCPLCDSNLFVGENIISKVYRPMNVPDQLMIVMGCPHCYPRCEPGLKRICPVCHKEVAPDQSLTARLFNKALGKKHVHVVGCSNCHKPRAQ